MVEKERLAQLEEQVKILEQQNIVLLDAINKVCEHINEMVKVGDENFLSLIRCNF